MTGSLEPPPPPQSESPQARSPPEPVARSDDDVDGHLDLGIDMAIVPPTSAPPSPPPEEEDDEEEDEAGEEPKPLPNPSRRTHGRKPKTKPLTPKQRVVAEEKLRVLANLDCQPFVPTSVDVDVSKHERVLRLLGLWDFVNLNLDQEIRKDLIVEFIAYYDHNRRTCVKNMRVVVGRMPLARALRLPEKKIYPSEFEESDRGLVEDQGTKAALVKFLLGWVVLVGEVGIVSDEGQAAIMKIESGQANKVDWAGLLWGMVHREVLDACKSGVCCYASHLQKLMRYQKPMLFEEEPPREVPVDEEEEEEDVAMSEAVCAEKGGDVGNAEPEKVEKELFHATTSGLASSDSGDLEQARQHQWFLGRKNGVDEHCLRLCSTNIVQSMEFDVDVNEGEHEIDTHETREDDFTSKFPNLVTSADLLQGMNPGNVSFVPTVQQPLDPSPGEFLASPIEACNNVGVNSTVAGSSLFGHVGRRPASKLDVDREDSDDDNQHFSQGNIAKRLRYDESWDQSSSACMEQAINWLEKARFISTQKEQAAMNSQMQLQYLTDLVQKKDQIIQSLQRSSLEDQHRMQLQFSQFEHERMVMSHMVVGYQKALRRAHQTFAEYRKKFPQCAEPLYMDVPGSGGIVLTVRENERQRLEKLESEKLILEKKVLEYNKIIRMLLDFSREWSGKFETHEDQVCQLAKRIDILYGETEILKVHDVENKCPDETKLLKDHTVENKHLGEMELLEDPIVENEHSGEMIHLKADLVENKQSDEMGLEKDHIMEDKHSDQIVEKDHLDETYSVDADS